MKIHRTLGPADALKTYAEPRDSLSRPGYRTEETIMKAAKRTVRKIRKAKNLLLASSLMTLLSVFGLLAINPSALADNAGTCNTTCNPCNASRDTRDDAAVWRNNTFPPGTNEQ